MMVFLLIFILCLLSFLVWASADIRSRVYVRSLCRKDCSEKVVALTFDDGPDPEMTPRVLEVLRRHGVRATFFLIGSRAEKHPELVRRMVQEGHVIGNHTYSHSGRSTIKASARYAEELEKTKNILERICGKRPRFFRPPFGVTNPRIGKAVEGRCCSIGWSIRSFDTIAKRSRENVYQRVVRRLHPGAVILLHDRCPEADRLLEMILLKIEREGYTAITVEQLFSEKAYEDEI